MFSDASPLGRTTLLLGRDSFEHSQLCAEDVTPVRPRIRTSVGLIDGVDDKPALPQRVNVCGPAWGRALQWNDPALAYFRKAGKRPRFTSSQTQDFAGIKPLYEELDNVIEHCAPPCQSPPAL